MPRPKGSSNRPRTEKKFAGYTDEVFRKPRTPVSGHTSLLPAYDQVVSLPLDNGWSKPMQVGNRPEGGEGPVAVDMDAAAAPVRFRAGKRNRRQVPVLPIQRKEKINAPIGTGLGRGPIAWIRAAFGHARHAGY